MGASGQVVLNIHEPLSSIPEGPRTEWDMVMGCLRVLSVCLCLYVSL